LADVDAYLHKSPRLWPPHIRRSLENYIMIKLAGPIGAAMAPPGELAGDPFAGEHWAHPDADWPGPAGLTAAEQHDLWQSTRSTVPSRHGSATSGNWSPTVYSSSILRLACTGSPLVRSSSDPPVDLVDPGAARSSANSTSPAARARAITASTPRHTAAAPLHGREQ
jgi:hypothetical protein